MYSKSRPHVLCIYHAHCSDGFGAAYAVWKALGDNVEYLPAAYGEEPPDVAGRAVFMVDFSYPRDIMCEMAEKAERIVVIDHHDTAEKQLVDLPDNVQVLFDQTKSGAVLAWEYFHIKKAVPLALKLIEDRDLWVFKYPETKAFAARMFSLPHSFDLWDSIITHKHVLDQTIQEGRLLLDRQESQVAGLTSDKCVVWLRSFPLPDGTTADIPAVNCSWYHASDVGHELNAMYKDSPFSATFMLNSKGVSLSLRSNKKDVHCGEVAKQFGGGGHPGAAGCSISLRQLYVYLDQPDDVTYA